MRAFEHYAPTQIVFGPSTETKVGNLVTSWGGSRVLLVYGGQSAVKSGLLDRVLSALTQAGLIFETLGGVQPNPRLSLVRKGIAQAKAFGADFILAVGGGSVIDTAKAIADGVMLESGDVWECLWKDKTPPSAALPVGVILTIPAAGSESSDSAVLTNEETGEKRGLSSRFHRPRFAILNPELPATLPPYQVACGVVDIMMHTMDRYFSPVTDNEMTNELAEALLRTVIRNGPLVFENPGNTHAMSEIMWAGSLSHNGLTGLGNRNDFVPHQLGHELSAKFDIAHGASLSAVWGSWASYCVEADPARFARFAVKVWGIDPVGKDEMTLARQAIDATVEYFRSLNMPTCFSELSCGVVSEEMLEELTWRCTFYGKRTIGTFRVLGRDDILAVYRLANH